MHNLAIRHSAEALVKRPNIGRILLITGKIKGDDVSRILDVQKKLGLRFGEAAVKLGVVSDDDIGHALSLQFHYPRLPAGSSAVDPAVTAALMPDDPQVEVLRTLRNQIAFRWYAKSKLLVVTSPSAGQGASRIAANLAVVFSQMGARTLLIDADMRNPRQHRLFRLCSRPGLSDVLAGRASGDIIRSIRQLTNLSVLPAGTKPPNPQELLVRPALTELFDDVSKRFDVVLIDTPPALECADAQALSARTGGALIVARRHHAKISDVEEIKRRLAVAGAEAIGAVLTVY